jgi:hypothetical protein
VDTLGPNAGVATINANAATDRLTNVDNRGLIRSLCRRAMYFRNRSPASCVPSTI